MSGYPDPDEEFELMYGDDFDVLRSQSEGNSTNHTPAPTTEISSQSSSKKRSINELFGNIDDIDDDHVDYIKEIELPKPKKLKTTQNDNVEKLALIEHILELRKRTQESLNNLGANGSRRKQCTTFTDNIIDNLSYRVPKYPFTVLTSTEGERIYVRTHSEAYWENEIKQVSRSVSFACGTTGSLVNDFDDVWNEAQQLIADEADKNEIAPVSSYNAADGNRLWVEVYKPRKYMELLSDEATNRTLLRWIKLWDRVVFGRRIKMSAKLTQFQMNFLEVEPDHRPKYKIVLLAGPPGLGKTTLAHLLSLHAGYYPMEVNASDDRSPDAFKKILENATTMTSVLDTEKRPNCLIFDEIDGAPSNSIDFLCKYIQGGIKQKTKQSKTASGKDNEDGKKGNRKLLKRPIIAICNDAYVPALRILRQMALVLHVPAITSMRLTERLSEICSKEDVKINRHALTTLAEKSNCDIRNCLSLLQFFKVQNAASVAHNSITLEQVLQVNHSKDVSKGLFQVWSDIFHIQRNKDKTFPSFSERTQKIQSVTNNFDCEKLSAGVFENYVRLSSVKDNMGNATKALDWFTWMDIINKKTFETQNYQLGGYLSWAFVQWHFIFGNLPHSITQRVFTKKFPNANKPDAKVFGATGAGAVANDDGSKIVFPKTSSDIRTNAQKTDATYSDVLKHMSSQIRPYVTKNSLVLDIVPMLKYIINPSLRPVNLHLYTQKEKDELARVVSTMLDYGLNYIQERTIDGTYVFKIDPNIDELSKFTTYNPSAKSLRILSYPNRQLVAREIELEKMRRLEIAKHKNVTANNQTVSKSEKVINRPNKQLEDSKSANLPNHLAKLTPKKINLKEKKAKTFFSFLKKSDNADKEEPSGKGGFGTTGIYFQFKEGHTNAVKKHIKISTLLH